MRSTQTTYSSNYNSIHAPEQNGLAERINRTRMERMRCILVDASLNETFWAGAAFTVVHLIKRVPCLEKSAISPEVWTNSKPDLSHLRVFGCKALVHVSKEKRTKLKPNSVKCMLVGYCST